MIKGDTRQHILETAIRLFESRGYAATTMRAIAEEAGVAPSNAYYWFRSKDDLVQAFYQRIQHDHRERVRGLLAGGGTLAERLGGVEAAFLEVVAPYHSFGTAFLATAIDPRASSSPFSPESGPARDLSREIYRDVVAGAEPAVPRRVADVLPDLLWAGHLGITLFWVIDTSGGQARTAQLVERVVPLVTGSVRLARLPGAAGVVDQLRGVLDLVVPR